MGTQKLSISFDGALAATVRRSAAADGISVSAWLAGAAADRARQVYLREALDAFDAEHGPLGDDELAAALTAARARSTRTPPARHAPAKAPGQPARRPRGVKRGA
jgi:hypothetical protein